MAFAEDYFSVAERLVAFREKYPAGSLQRVGPLEVFEIEGVSYLAYTAAAYRTPDDERPGMGTAWERVPGLTSFTKNSEAQNAESSAWGRAIIAVGAADSKKGIASQEDVRNRQEEQDYYASPEYAESQAVPGLRSSIEAAIGKLDDDAKAALKAWFAENNLPAVRRMGSNDCDRVLDHLMTLPAEPAKDDTDDGARFPIEPGS